MHEHGNLDPPMTVDIELSWQCNHRCLFCAYLDQHRREFLPVDVFERIVAFCREKRVPWVLLSGGGEPTLHPQFGDLLEILGAAKQRYVLYTNGSRLGRYAGRLRQCGYLRVSLDAARAETYAKVHSVPEGEFKRIVENLRAIRRAHEGMVIGLSFVVVRANLEETHAVVRLAESLHLDTVLFRTDINERGSAAIAKPESKRVNVAWRDAQEHSAHRSRHCYGSALKMVIDAGGTQTVCCRLRDRDHVIGNVAERDIEELWGSPRQRALLERIDPSVGCPPCRFRALNNLAHGALSDERARHGSDSVMSSPENETGSNNRMQADLADLI